MLIFKMKVLEYYSKYALMCIWNFNFAARDKMKLYKSLGMDGGGREYVLL